MRHDDAGDRGARPRRQPGERAHARASSSWSTCRARPTSPAWSPTARSRRADPALEERTGPRVGDGLVRLEPDGTIIYASPNALSAFHRLGRHRSGAVRADRRADQHGGRRPVRRQRPRRRGGRRGRRRASGHHRGRGRRGDRSRSGRCRCARAARRSARWCSCRTSPSCAAGTGRS